MKNGGHNLLSDQILSQFAHLATKFKKKNTNLKSKEVNIVIILYSILEDKFFTKDYSSTFKNLSTYF